MCPSTPNCLKQDWRIFRSTQLSRSDQCTHSPSGGLEVNTSIWYFHRVTTKNRNHFQNIFVKSFSWVGSLLRDHTRWAETQLQGSKMDSLDSFAQITLLFNKLVSRMKTLQFCSDYVRWDWRIISGGWLSQLSVNWWVRGKMLCGFLPRFPPSQ